MAWNPGERDIVCGRLMGFYNHVGNRRFRKLVDYHVDDSVLAHAEMHTKSIMDILLHSGYRFVRISHHGEIEPAPPNEPVSMVRNECCQGCMVNSVVAGVRIYKSYRRF